MNEWWSSLTALNQAFYVAAAFFSLVFIWQFFSSLIGLGGGEADAHAGMDAHAGLDAHGVDTVSAAETIESVSAFRMLTIRALMAFCTLFFWAAALYLDADKPVARALLYALGWGLAAWLIVTLLVNWMRGLAETGTQRLESCVGAAGTVYLNIPADGQGEVRVPVSEVISMVRARAAGGVEIKAGTPIRVVRMLSKTTVEVEPVESEGIRKEGEE